MPTIRRRRRRYRPVVTLRPALTLVGCGSCHGNHYPGNARFCALKALT
jgi:hypothetical protein